jgi:hypothetical protein
MKVQIENTIIQTSERLFEFNSIVRDALNSKSIEDLKSALDYQTFYKFKYGFGSTHCWVKQIDVDGQLLEQRVLLITENK